MFLTNTNNSYFPQFQPSIHVMGQFNPHLNPQFLDADDDIEQAHTILDNEEKLLKRKIRYEKKYVELEQYQTNRQYQQRLCEEEIHWKQNEIYNLLHFKNIYLWQQNNIFFFQIQGNEEILHGDKDEISLAISSNLRRRIIIVDDINEIDKGKSSTTYILSYHIQTIHAEVFRPDINFKIFQESNQYYLNTYTPANYLEKRTIPLEEGYQCITINFLKAMVNHDIEKFQYIVDLFSFTFQNLYKQGTALVLTGDKRVTENILIDTIIEKLFNAKYCISINDNILKNKSIHEIVKQKFIYHIGELSEDTAQSIKLQNLIKTILLEHSISSIDDATGNVHTSVIHGQTIITSNSPEPIIKNSYSQCTIIEVNDLDEILTSLGIQDLMELCQKIYDDLDNFTNILLNRQITDDFYNRTIHIDQKSEDENIQDYIYAIQNKQITFFKKMKHKDVTLYYELLKDFENYNAIKQPKLYDYFNALFKENTFKDNGTFLKMLKNRNDLFSEKTKQIGSTKYYLLKN